MARTLGDESPLTTREHQVVVAAMTGLSAKATALKLGISASTVRTHRKKALARLGVQSMGHAMVVMLQQGWVLRFGLIPDYTGPVYGASKFGAHAWVPSPAQRLYLDSFDRLLKDRTVEAVDDAAFFYRVLQRETTTTHNGRGRPDVDALLLRIARACIA